MFTEQEINLIKRFESASRWDNLIFELSALVPCFIIMGSGLRFESPVTVVVGMFVYAVVRMYVHYTDVKDYPLRKSTFSKISKHMLANQAREEAGT